MPDFAQSQFIFVSQFGSVYTLPVIVSLSLSLFLIEQGHRKHAILLLVTLLSVVYATFLKLVFQLPRPAGYISHSNIIGDMYGFPSSHVTFYTAFWGFTIYAIAKLKRINKYLKFAVIAISAYYLVLIGGSRIALGAHSVTDVIGGYFFGSLYLGALIYIDKNSRLKLWQKDKAKNDKSNNSSN
jgi:undecaprenyl-diphosphatase